MADPEPGGCEAKHFLDATTGSGGAFALCPIPDFQFFLHVMAHRRSTWNVCVAAEEGWRLVETGSQYTLVDSGPRLLVHLTCDLANRDKPCQEIQDTDVTEDKAREALGDLQCKGVRRDD